MKKRIGFIGAGKVGCSLGRYIKEKAGEGFLISGYFSKDPASAKMGAEFAGGQAFENVCELAAKSDLLLFTVPDSQIAEAWLSLEEALRAGEKLQTPLFIGHCSGNLTSEVFSPKNETFAFGSIHPIISVPDRLNSSEKFEGAYFSVEGDPVFIDFAEILLTALGNPFSTINADKKTLYHAACVTISNLVCALAYTGEKLFKECGFGDQFAESAWRTLFLENAKNIADPGPVMALTGPVERGDASTVAMHLDTLTGDEKEIYLQLSRMLIQVARQKNPDRDYTGISNLLDTYHIKKRS